MDYPQVKFPKKITKRWLDRAFAPLTHYLEREYPEEAHKIMPYMSFMANDEHKFYYRNVETKGYIIFDQTGKLVSCDRDALKYEFYRQKPARVASPEKLHIHPTITNWVSKHLSKKQIHKYGEDTNILLQKFWGPIVNYNFDDLKAHYPKRGKRTAYCLYVYPSKFQKLICFQIVGDEIVTKDCSVSQYQKFLKREADLMAEGWHVVTIIQELMDEEYFPLYLQRAIELADYRDFDDLVFELTALGKSSIKVDKDEDEK